MPDLDKILKMSEIFDVSTDALLKEEMDLNERNTTFEDLQNERMKMEPSDMANPANDKNSIYQQFEEERHEVKKFQHIMFLCRRQRSILSGQSIRHRGSLLEHFYVYCLRYGF